MRLRDHLGTYIDRCNDALRRRSSDLAASNIEVPAEVYLDPARYTADLALIRAAPTPLIALGDLPSPGGHAAVDGLRPLETLVTHDVDGSLRAFENKCRHRGARLVSSACTQERMITCPYHAWSYDLSGRLSAVYGTQHGIDRDHVGGLVARPSLPAAGFLWSIGDLASPYSGLASVLDEELQALGVVDPSTHAAFSIDGAFNWKIGIEAFLEVYHFKAAHSKTLALTHYNTALFDRLGPLARIGVPLAPIESANVSAMLRTTNLMYFIAPCHFFLVFEGHFGWLSVTPLAVDRSRLTYRGLSFVKAPPAALRERIQGSVAGLKVVMQEDIAICESIQAGLAAGDRFHLTRYEPGIAAFHETMPFRPS